jgi:hypothetical protein
MIIEMVDHVHVQVVQQGATRMRTAQLRWELEQQQTLFAKGGFVI